MCVCVRVCLRDARSRGSGAHREVSGQRRRLSDECDKVLRSFLKRPVPDPIECLVRNPPRWNQRPSGPHQRGRVFLLSPRPLSPTCTEQLCKRERALSAPKARETNNAKARGANRALLGLFTRRPIRWLLALVVVVLLSVLVLLVVLVVCAKIGCQGAKFRV